MGTNSSSGFQVQENDENKDMIILVTKYTIISDEIHHAHEEKFD
jgi:hypothetical protein